MSFSVASDFGVRNSLALYMNHQTALVEMHRPGNIEHGRLLFFATGYSEIFDQALSISH